MRGSSPPHDNHVDHRPDSAVDPELKRVLRCLRATWGRCRAAIPSPMRHLEARGFQDFAKIAKEFPGRVVGAADLGRRANTTIQVSRIQVSRIQVSEIQVAGIQVS
jgi:hypothetical protein